MWHENWAGEMTPDNIGEIVERIEALLSGKRYTFISANEGMGWTLEIRAGQELRPDKTRSGQAISTWKEAEAAGFNCSDTYGVWCLSTTSEERPYLQFGSRNESQQILISHRAPSGRRLEWAVVIEG